MPLRNERGDAVLVFSGEDFPEPDTGGGLGSEDTNSTRQGPLISFISMKTDSCLSGGIEWPVSRSFDRPEPLERRTLFNDRYGMHRIYYHRIRGCVLLCRRSESDSCCCARNSGPIDPQSDGRVRCVRLHAGRAERSSRACDCCPRFEVGISQRFSGAEETPTSIRAIGRTRKSLQSRRPFTRSFETAFSRNLPRYFGGPEQVAMSLTGGLDTRMILAWQQAEPGSLPCYTFGSMFRENHDVRVARRVAKGMRAVV